ncbi:MAG: hypothetical protein ACFHU9_15375 [Fluviicola sp.]
MRRISSLFMMGFFVALFGCHSVQGGKIRYKKVPRVSHSQETAESRPETIEVRELEDSEEQIHIVRESSETDRHGKDLDYSKDIVHSDLTRTIQIPELGEGSTDNIFNVEENQKHAGVTPSDQLKKGVKKDGEYKEFWRKVIEVLFYALLIFSLVAIAGVLGETMFIVGIIVAGAMLLTIIIVLIYNYSQGS